MVSQDDEVMVIEDERESRNYLVQVLELEGFKVKPFANGVEAMSYLAGGRLPCLIVLDIRMPVMDGAEFREVMLKDERLAKVPVVVVTAFEPPAASTLRALRVFRKPVDIDALLGTVKEHC